MSRERPLLILLMLVYAALGSLFAILTPAWQIPDEPAHYNYARQLAEHRRCCPIIEPGDWDQTYLEQLKAARFAPDLLDNLEAIQYEDHQPPLYYQVVSLVYGWFGDGLIAMRLISVLFGAGVVLCTYALARALLPDRPGAALGAAAFVAFLPQHVAMIAAVNNDSLVELLIGAVLLITTYFLLGQTTRNRWLGVRFLITALLGLTVLLVARRIPSSVGAGFLALIAVGALVPSISRTKGWQIWMLGVLVGLIFTTKATGYFLAALVPLAILLRYRGTFRAIRRWDTLYLRMLGIKLMYFLIPALILGGLWWLRNFSTYGFPDFLGLRMHDLVVADQLRTADFIAASGSGVYLNEWVWTTFRSFWGQFGWMALPLQGGMYSVFLGLTLFAVIGLLIDRLVLPRRTFRRETARRRRMVWIILGLTLALTFLAYVYYNSVFVQFQGRYLYPALIPIALLLALGIDAWRRWVLPGALWAQWLPLAVFGLLAPLDLYLLLRVIRPLLLP
ncbi:MAG: glycosyltransferase family 39 protein [Anaerolineae bacterium]|nr:glycosyltransferase family 39 protein [Anaerolineae bacterium]